MKLSKLKHIIKEQIQKLTEQQSIPCGDSFIFSATGCVNPGQFTCSAVFSCFEFTGDNCLNDPNNSGWGGDINPDALPAQFFTLEECCQAPSTEFQYNTLPASFQETALETCPNGIGPGEEDICSDFENEMQVATSTNISIDAFCTKCATNSWDPWGQEVTQYCDCCPAGQPSPEGMPVINKFKKDPQMNRMQKLAGIPGKLKKS